MGNDGNFVLEDYCQYYKDHMKAPGGDVSVFTYGGAVCCDNGECPHGNFASGKRQIEGEGPKFRVCGTDGLKKALEEAGEAES